MTTWLDNLEPIPRIAGKHTANAAHARLRALVLDGTIPPGAELNQVDISERLGLSRTPVREAIRMLQEEGLVDAEPWKRARVVGFDAAHLEAVYVQRVMLEGLALCLTVPLMTEADLDHLDEQARELGRAPQDASQTDAWTETHSAFHLGLVAGATEHLGRTIRGHMQRAEHYKRLYQYRGPRPSFQHIGEHEQIVELCQARDAAGAANELAAHLARTALSLIGQLAPRYDPAAIRVTLDIFQTGQSRTLLVPRGGRSEAPAHGAATAV